MELTTSQRITGHLRANVVAYLALFAALTLGPAWAATQTAPKNSVTSKSIKDGQVKSADIGDDEITSADIGDAAVTGADIDESTLSGVPLPPCPNNQILKSTGSGYNCASDADTDTNSGGTVTSVNTGAGLNGGPITGAGTLSLQSCPNGQLLKSNGSSYACGPDVDTNSGGDITDVIAGNGLVGGNSSGSATLGLPSCATSSILRSNGFGAGYVCSGETVVGTSTSGATINVCCNPVAHWSLNYASPVTITGISGTTGEILTLVAISNNITLNDSGNFFLAGNWTPDNSDTLTLSAGGSGSDWTEVARSAN